MTAHSISAIDVEQMHSDRWVARWLFLCAGMVFAMAVIGAITRLTESGLSIMEWAPLSGALPPLERGGVAAALRHSTSRSRSTRGERRA